MTHTKAAFTDWTFPDLALETEILRPTGCDVAARQCKTEAELKALCADADVVVTQFARLTPAVISGLARARAIVRYGIGVDNIDLEAAKAHAIPVCNVPDYCIHEVADHTLALMLALTRQIVPHNSRVHGGQWGLATPLSAFCALRERTVGVVGFGRIGREVVKRLLAFQCRVLVFDPVVTAATIAASGAEPASLESLLSDSDIVTLHCPSNAQTRRLISAEALQQLKPGALIVNVARGDLIDSTALIAALTSARLAGAGLDVFDPEPIPPEHPILKLPNVVLAPHAASCSDSAVTLLRKTVAELAAEALRGGTPRNVVNGVAQFRM